MTCPQLSSSRGVTNAGASPSSPFHPLQTCCCRSLPAAPRSRSRPTRIRESARCRHPGVVRCSPLSGAGDLERKGEARWRLDRAVISVSSQRYGSSPHAPLLAASYSLSFCFSISPSRSTHTLAPAAWQPLVSFTQLLCCLGHSQHPHTQNTHTHTPPSKQHWDGCSNQNVQSPPLYPIPPLFALPPRLIWLRYKLLPQNVTGIPQPRRAEKCWPVNAAAKVFLVQRSSIL